MGAVLSLIASATLNAQSRQGTTADSAPLARFIAVEPNVKLEVLDWGGSGPPVVFLAGLGNTAHVFEDFAPRLRASHHVYGVTRRGFGKSSLPRAGYSPDRLGDDVLAVMDSLRLVKPVLIGHSIAGEELSSIGSRRGDRVAALIYLDAADSYAFYDTTRGDLRVDLAELRRKLDSLRQMPSARLIDELLKSHLPTFERDLHELRAALDEPPPSTPPIGAPDRSSFSAFRAWRAQSFGFAIPLAELHEQFAQLPDGSVGAPLRSPDEARFVSESIVGSLQKFTRVAAPVLAIFARPDLPATFPSAAAKAAFVTRDSTYRMKQADLVRRASPYVRIVDIAGASHYVFLTHPDDVLREINAFLAPLPAGAKP